MKHFMIGKKLAIAGVTAAMLLGECVSAMGSVFFEDEGNVYVYALNGNYMVTNIASGETVEIANGMDYGHFGDVEFSPDGKYMYYTIENDAGDSEELWRCEYRKLKAGSTDNEQYCQFVTSDIKMSSITITDKGIVFEDTNYNLCYFDGSTVRSIGQEVNKFWCSEDGEKIVFECGTNPRGRSRAEEDIPLDETLVLYGVETNNLDNIFVLANDYWKVFDITDFDNILFIQELDDEDQPYIYVTDFANELRYLGRLVTGMEEPENGAVYYTRESEKDWDVNQIYTDSRGETEEFLQIKEQFAQDKNTEFLKDLFVYKNGQEKRIDMLIGSVKYLGHTLMYETMKNLIPIDLAMEEWDFQNLKDANAYYWVSEYKDESVHMIDQGGYWQLYEQNANVYMNNKDILLEEVGMDETKSLALASVSNEVSVFDSFTRIAQNTKVVAMDESTIYYEIEKENTNYYDVYKLTEGNSICVAQGVDAGIIIFFSDGSTMFRSYNNSLILMDKNGSRQEIAKDVLGYVRLDESTILYISDPNLWIWKDGENKLLVNDVENMICCSNALEKVYDPNYIYSIFSWNHRHDY